MATFTNFERSIAVLGSTGSGSTGSSKRRAATLVDAGEVFPGKDVALIKVAARNMATVPLGDDTALGAGDRLFVLGFPGAATFNPTLSKASQGEPTLTQGVLSAKKGVNGGYTVLQTDAGMTHGNSGGPVLDEQGKVVGHVVAEVRVPDGLALTVPAVGGGSVWALALDTEVSAMLDPRVSLARIDPASNRITARIPVPGTGLGGVVAMAYGAGSVWLVDSDQASHDVVSKVDPGRNRVVDRTTVGIQPVDVAFSGEAVWVLNSVDETVSRIDPASDKVVATVRLPDLSVPDGRAGAARP